MWCNSKKKRLAYTKDIMAINIILQHIKLQKYKETMFSL